MNISPLLRSLTGSGSSQATGESTGEKPVIGLEPAEESGFEGHLRAFFSSVTGNEVSEEELFAGLLQERLEQLKGPEVAEEFASRLAEHKVELTRADGYVPVEKAAKLAMNDMVEAGHLTEEEHLQVSKQAFMAAQLDDNHDQLYDGRGSAEDPTIATASLETALVAAQAALNALDQGELPPGMTEEVDLDSTGEGELVTPNGTFVDGGDGFLFKPQSESDGRLVVLLPAVMTGQIEDLLLKDEDGNILERGRSAGVANGDREHFRFEHSGSEYPKNLTVEVRLASGDVKQYQIPNPSERYD